MIRLPPQHERAWTRRTVEDMARERAAMDAEVERELEKWFASMERISPRQLREFRHTNPVDTQTNL